MQAVIITFKSKLKLLNSNLISQKYNQHIEIEEIYEQGNNLPPWNLNFEILNGDLTKSFTIRSRQELGYFYLLPNGGEEITYKFEKEHC